MAVDHLISTAAHTIDPTLPAKRQRKGQLPDNDIVIHNPRMDPRTLSNLQRTADGQAGGSAAKRRRRGVKDSQSGPGDVLDNMAMTNRSLTAFDGFRRNVERNLTRGGFISVCSPEERIVEYYASDVLVVNLHSLMARQNCLCFVYLLNFPKRLVRFCSKKPENVVAAATHRSASRNLYY